MPIKSTDENSIFERLDANWSIVEDGVYDATIKDVTMANHIQDGRRPIQWTLFLDDHKQTLDKFHWIDLPGGINMLVDDLKRLGLKVTPETATSVCNSLIGTKIRIQVETISEHQNILFKGRL